jgi:hypothetical protein
MGFHYPRDCQAQGQPGHGVPDPLDIDNGTSQDCNLNGIPDECEGGVPPECEGNPVAPSFSTDADFDQGMLINVHHDSPDGDQLQRCRVARPLPYIGVPGSGTSRGTLIRFRTDADHLGEFVGEYYTAPGKTAASPSRTGVDLNADVWVANRDDDNGGTGSVTKIGLVIGGTRCDANGHEDGDGEYLKPPFIYNTCIDRDQDGLIHTSRGLADKLLWPGPYPNGGLAVAEDECICQYVRVATRGTRHVSVNRDNDLWVGGFLDFNFVRLEHDTGQFLNSFNVGYGGYGGLLDCGQYLWSSHRTGGAALLRAELNQQQELVDWTLLESNSYGLAMDGLAKIWSSQWGGHKVKKYDSSGTLLGTFDTAADDPYNRGVAVRLADNPLDDSVWVADSVHEIIDNIEIAGHRVSRLAADDGQIEDVIDITDHGSAPTAIAIDQDRYVWVACRDSDNVLRIDPGAVAPQPDVDFTVDLGVGAAPYAYSDMTGQVSLQTTGAGTWNVVHDSEKFGAPWHVVAWNREACVNPQVPTGTELTVEMRAADAETALTSQPYVTLTGNTGYYTDPGVRGRYLELRVRFKGSCPGDDFATPVLCDLRAYNGLADMNCDGVADVFDIDPFVLALTSTPPNYPEYYAQYPHCNVMNADVDCDGTPSPFDIDPFVACLLSENGCVCP